jgi:predicted negative regulator of RcsB-dependent stress response
MKDLKNVIITFGLIGLVFIQGYYVYQNKIKKENTALADKQEKLRQKNLAQKPQAVTNQKATTVNQTTLPSSSRKSSAS